MAPEEKDSVDQDIAAISQRGYQLLREEQYADANDHFQQVLDREPDNSYALVGLGDSARKQHDYETAIQYYRTCLDHDQDNSYALFGLTDQSVRVVRIEFEHTLVEHESESCPGLSGSRRRHA